MQDIAPFLEVNPLSSDNPRIVEIQRVVCGFYQITMTDLLSDRCGRELAWARQAAMYLTKCLTFYSLSMIGKVFRRDHTTVMHAIRATERRLTKFPELGNDLTRIKDLLAVRSRTDVGRIERQLARIAHAGFVPSGEQKTLAGQAEYVKALADIPPHLLELAVDRLIREREDKWFPLPAQIRVHIADELAKLRRGAVEEDITAMKSDLRAKFPNAAFGD